MRRVAIVLAKGWVAGMLLASCTCVLEKMAIRGTLLVRL